jgi:hypothetical protein
MSKQVIQLLLFSTLMVLVESQLSAQLSVLSSGSAKSEWRSTQLQLIEQQLTDSRVAGPLRKELEAQKSWLGEWSPGRLTDKPQLAQKQTGKRLLEPILDPNRRAGVLRQKLLGKGAQPTASDTDQLQQLLIKFPKDIGLHQLYLHWLDQKQFREDYAPTVVAIASELAAQLEASKKADKDYQLAQAFCLYRAARAMIFMESVEYQNAKPIADLKEHEAKLLGFYTQMCQLVGQERPEFILVEIRMLCRDNWFGKALVLLEENASIIEKPWYLQQRHELLRNLSWTQPAEEAETIALAATAKLDSGARSAEVK